MLHGDVTEARVCERPMVELATSLLLVRRPNHYIILSRPKVYIRNKHFKLKLMLAINVQIPNLMVALSSASSITSSTQTLLP